jgi:AcrR family transcriptional regulator
MSSPRAAPAPPPTRRRYARGEKRIAEILEAAASVFADMGYEQATTNAIAAKAGISPGSLYQFFSNKDAIARRLAENYEADVRGMWATLFTDDAARLPLAELLDRIIGPILEFKLKRQGFAAFFEGSQTMPELAAVATGLHGEFIERMRRLLALRRPDLPEGELALSALVAVRTFKALLPMAIDAKPARRAAIVAEIKRALLGYLEPTFGTRAAGAMRKRHRLDRSGRP